jgi:4-alpha-glucanotransferase
MEPKRNFGVLLHPTCLPGPWGVGVFGQEARAFIDWLHAAGASWWQVLPLGPTGYGDSPYQAISSFAGNPYLIDPQGIFDKGWLDSEAPPHTQNQWVDFGWLYKWKWKFLKRAYAGFSLRATPAEVDALTSYRKDESYWMEDYALYRTLKTRFDQQGFHRWPRPLRLREANALEQAKTERTEDSDFHVWTQWVFADQWKQLKAYAAQRAVGVIGDLPIFVAHDSPEVWAHPEQFHLDEDSLPHVVAGVPPDYFSETGQLWGNPLYAWKEHAKTNFQWWLERFRCCLSLFDLVRIDHFRGFESCWEVPRDATTAIHGHWVKAPGRDLFAAIQDRFGPVPVFAEDLGVITSEVEALRNELGFPGMKVLQFAFDGDDKNPYLPHRHEAHGRFVVYTGTHDNETTLGWYRNLDASTQHRIGKCLDENGYPAEAEEKIPWSFIGLAFGSPACLNVIPLQDIMGLGNQARLNTPAKAQGNWAWRYRAQDLKPSLAQDLYQLASQTKRL